MLLAGYVQWHAGYPSPGFRIIPNSRSWKPACRRVKKLGKAYIVKTLLRHGLLGCIHFRQTCLFYFKAPKSHAAAQLCQQWHLFSVLFRTRHPAILRAYGHRGAPMARLIVAERRIHKNLSESPTPGQSVSVLISAQGNEPHMR